MCLVLYIGSKKELPLIAPQDFSGVDSEDARWPEKVVPFSVEEFTGDEKVVAKHFETPFVRYAGSYGGCGCGFNACFVRDWEEPAEGDARTVAGRISRERLRAYVETNGVSQIYACWSGDECQDPEGRLDIASDTITDWSFEFSERTMLTLTQSRS